MPDPAPFEPFDVSRPLPRWGGLAFLLGLLLNVAWAPAVLVLSLEAWSYARLGMGDPGLLGDLLKALSDQLPLADVAWFGSTVGLAFVPMLAWMGGAFWVRRRFGSVEVHADHLVFRFALAPRWTHQTIPADQVLAREPHPWGLVLQAEGRARAAGLFFPLLVPARDEATQARVLAVLDRACPEPDAEEVSFGRRLPPWVAAAVVIPLFLLSGPPAVVAALRFGQEWALSLFVCSALSLAALVALADAKLLQPRYRRLHFAGSALVLGNRRIPYTDLSAAAQQGPWLALVAKGKRLLAWLGDEAEPAVAVLQERLAAVGAPLQVASLLPPWAQPRARKRWAGVLLAVLAAKLALELGLATSDPALYDDVYLLDDDDQYVRVVYRVSDHQVRLVSLLEDQPGSGWSYFLDDRIRIPGLVDYTLEPASERHFELDLVDGRGWHDQSGNFQVDPATTWHQVDAQGKRRSATVALPAALVDVVAEAYDQGLHTDSIPALLSQVLGDVDDPVVQAYLRGETSRRTWDVRGGGWRLLWGVDCGEPVFAVVAPEGLPLDLSVGNFRHDDEGGSPVDVRCRFAWFASANSPCEDLGAPPSLEQLQAATAAIQAGQSAREVCEPLLRRRLTGAAQPPGDALRQR